jgi:hypothetical protein
MIASSRREGHPERGPLRASHPVRYLAGLSKACSTHHAWLALLQRNPAGAAKRSDNRVAVYYTYPWA